MFARIAAAVLTVCLFICFEGAVYGGEDSGLLFHAPLNGDTSLLMVSGPSKPITETRLEYFQGAGKIEAAVTNKPMLVIYEAAGNLHAGEGTASIWVRPLDWNTDDAFHKWFVAAYSTEEQEKLSEGGRLSLFKEKDGLFCAQIGSGGAGRKSIFLRAKTKVWEEGDWVFLAVTWRPGAAEFYINGKQCQSAKIPAEMHPRSFGKIRVGGHSAWSEGGEERKTALSNFRIHGRALAPDEITALYENDGKWIARLAPAKPVEVSFKVADISLKARPGIVGTVSEDYGLVQEEGTSHFHVSHEHPAHWSGALPEPVDLKTMSYIGIRYKVRGYPGKSHFNVAISGNEFNRCSCCHVYILVKKFIVSGSN